MLISRSVHGLLLALCLFGVGSLEGRAQSGPAAGPLRVHPTNPRYFTDGSGKAIYLTGSHVWMNLKDFGNTDPPAPFNFTGYLDFLQSTNQNFIRLWTWEPFTQSDLTFVPPDNLGAWWGAKYISPFPWQRTGPGLAWDGKPKFNLTLFNQAYFDRLRSRIIAARARGIYVSIMLFEGDQVHVRPPTHASRWPVNPWNHVLNNINGVNGDPNGDGVGVEIQTLAIPAITNMQKAYIKKVIDTVNDLDNVLYEICNEAHPTSKDWQYALINYIHAYEAGQIDGIVRKRHPVGMSFNYSHNDVLFNSPADWISPGNRGASYAFDPPAATGAKVVIPDTDHVWTDSTTGPVTIPSCRYGWVWKTFTRGLHPISMDAGLYVFPPDPWAVAGNPADWIVKIRRALGHTRTYSTKMNLAGMKPQASADAFPSSTKHCLFNPGSEYLVYAPSGGSFTVNLAAGTYAYEWFNPSAGTVAGTGSFTAAAGNRSFTVPFAGDGVLYLKAGAPPTQGNGTGLTGEYFDNMDFTSLKVTRTDATVNFDWGAGSPHASIAADTFSDRWTGQVEAPASGTYTFTTVSDDGVRLWVNNQLLVNNWTLHAPTENSGSIVLTGGQKVPIKMEHYENGGGAVAKLLWAGPGIAKQIVPQTRLFPAGAQPPPPPGGTLGHWKLDEASGTTAIDSSGNGNTATLFGGATRTPGISGGAVRFDGVSGHVRVPASSTLNSLGNQMTIAAWVYRELDHAGVAVVANRQFGPGFDDQYILALPGDRCIFGVHTTAGYPIISGNQSPKGQWFHFAGTYDGAAIRMYVNGVLAGSLAASGNVVSDPSKPLVLGAGQNDATGGVSEFFGGRVDDVRLYGRALTSSEIQALAVR